MIYFTSDLHFGHANIIRLCNRPFADADEMDEALIANWNRRVGPADTVYLVGDIVWDHRKVPYYMERLAGKKILISSGNHDASWVRKEACRPYFEDMVPYLETRLCGHPVTLCHYPLLEWRDSREDTPKHLGYLIHGHIHNRVSEEYHALYVAPHALNAGVDVNGYVPVTFEELLANNMAFKAEALPSPADRALLESRYQQWVLGERPTA